MLFHRFHQNSILCVENAIKLHISNRKTLRMQSSSLQSSTATLTIIFSLSQERETYSTALTDSESTAGSPPSVSSLGATLAEFQGYDMGE